MEGDREAVEGTSHLFREIAEAQHHLWGHWALALLERGAANPDGSVTVDAQTVAEWQRLATTPWDELSKTEREPRYGDARRVMAVLTADRLGGEVAWPSRRVGAGAAAEKGEG